MKRYPVLGALLLGAAACQDATSPRFTATPAPEASPAQVVASNDYIVTFRSDEVDPEGQARALVAAYGGSIRFVYRTAIKGFAVAGLADGAVDALARNPRVAAIEHDGTVTIDGTQSPTPSWGLDRIDAPSGLNSSYTYPNDGTGVHAYIVDTGINSSHVDFTGRLGAGYDFVGNDSDPEDCNGHGTHVAGTVGGTTYGVAKNVTIVAVRVLNCAGSGTWSGVIAGIDWVAAHAVAPAVANMSLGGGYSSSVNNAVAGAVNAGVTFAVAAGNSTANACNYSPASTPSAITVGATTSSDALASYSNFGSCVDINAPGSSITSDWKGTTTATNTISGTSMASPHVAGAAALYLSANPGASPAQVASALTGNATSGALSGIPSGTPNLLVYVGFIGASSGGGGGGGGGGGSTPPNAGFSVSCGGDFSCDFTAAASGLQSYSWSFGDGGSGSGASTTHTYAQKGGSYTVVLTVSDATTSASSSQTVSCNPKKGCKP